MQFRLAVGYTKMAYFGLTTGFTGIKGQLWISCSQAAFGRLASDYLYVTLDQVSLDYLQVALGPKVRIRVTIRLDTNKKSCHDMSVVILCM